MIPTLSNVVSTTSSSSVSSYSSSSYNRVSNGNKIFSRPPILLSIGKFLDSTELCKYSKISKSVHSIWCYHHSPYSQFFIKQINFENKQNFSGTIKCNVTENGLKFEWKCTKKEYENLLQQYNSDQFIECKAFEEPKTKTKWFIEIFPNGYHLSKNGYAAIFLTMEWKPKHINEVRARLLCNCPQVNLKFSDGVTYDWKKFSKGKHNAFKINDVLNNNYIVLTVELIIIDVTESESRINNEMKEEMDEVHKKMLHLQSRMDEIDSVSNRLFNIEQTLNLMYKQQLQQLQKYSSSYDDHDRDHDQEDCHHIINHKQELDVNLKHPYHNSHLNHFNSHSMDIMQY